MKRRTWVILDWVVLIAGYGILTSITADLFGTSSLLSRGIALIVWCALYWGISTVVMRLRTNQLAHLWQLADQLGYGPAELKAKSTATYGVIDWSLSRPENLQFLPRDIVVSRLIKQLTAEAHSEQAEQ